MLDSVSRNSVQQSKPKHPLQVNLEGSAVHSIRCMGQGAFLCCTCALRLQNGPVTFQLLA